LPSLRGYAEGVW